MTGLAGVRWSEIDYSYYIASLLNSPSCFQGVTQKGTIGKAILVSSWADYQRKYGGLLRGYQFPLICKRALDAGAKLYVNRVVHATDVTDRTTITAAKSTRNLIDRGSPAAPAAITSVNAAPFNLEPNQTLIFAVNALANQIATFLATAASIQSGNVEPYAITAGMTLIVRMNGGDIQTITFQAGDTTALKVAQRINDQIRWASATVVTGYAGTYVVITSDLRGTDSSIQILGGTANAVLNFSVAIQTGTGNVANIDETTAAEVAAIINAAVTSPDVTAVANAGGTVTVTTILTGATASIQVTVASTATGVGFDNNIHVGTNATGGLSTLRVQAINEGTWGDSISVVITDGKVDAVNYFRIAVYDGATLVEDSAIFGDLSMLDTNDAYYVENVVNEKSEYIRVTDLDSATVAPNDRPALGTSALTAGDDGLVGLGDLDYIGDSSSKLGMYAFDDVDDAIPLATPGVTSADVITAGINYCEGRRDMVYYCEPPAELEPQEAKEFRLGESPWTHAAFSSSYGAMYYGNPKVLNPLNGVKTFVSPLGDVAGVYANTLDNWEAWYAAAGFKRGKINASELYFNVGTKGNQAQGGLLYDNQVNPLLHWKDSAIMVWGNKTLQRIPSSLSFLHVRVLMINIEKAVTSAVRADTFDPNDPISWRAVWRKVDSFIKDIKRRRGVYDYRVECDQNAETVDDAVINTPDRVQRGEFRCQIFVKPTIDMEELRIEFIVVGTDVNFEEFVLAA